MTTRVRRAQRELDVARKDYKLARYGLATATAVVLGVIYAWYAAISWGLESVGSGVDRGGTVFAMVIGLIFLSLGVIFLGVCAVAWFADSRDEMNDAQFKYEDVLDEESDKWLK